MHLDHQGHQLELLPEHAVFLPASETLVVADVHLGKAATFQASGLAVPAGDDARDLERLGRLASDTAARRLVLAGDLFHSPRGRVPDLLGWLEELGVPVTLVLGNHDRHPQVDQLPLEVVGSLELDGLHIVHDPADADHDHFALCGHLHPAIRLREARRPSLRLPCFHLTGGHLVLPSFGSFTGGHPVRLEKGDRVFVSTGEEVREATQLC